MRDLLKVAEGEGEWLKCKMNTNASHKRILLSVQIPGVEKVPSEGA